jgi:hypothetical protein
MALENTLRVFRSPCRHSVHVLYCAIVDLGGLCMRYSILLWRAWSEFVAASILAASIVLMTPAVSFAAPGSKVIGMGERNPE